jgi:hypothetical protein
LSKAQPSTPHVGIFYFFGGKLWLETTPLPEAERYADGITHSGSHIDYWDKLARAGAVPQDEYDEHPRGRVNFNKKTDRYLLLADKCILEKPEMLKQIMTDMKLPATQTDVLSDSHYKCYRCLGGSRK